jgi:hypothetical protein
VAADQFRQPEALGGDRACAGGDPVDVRGGLFDELHRLLRRGGGIDTVVAPATPGVETLDVGPLGRRQQPAGKGERAAVPPDRLPRGWADHCRRHG